MDCPDRSQGYWLVWEDHFYKYNTDESRILMNFLFILLEFDQSFPFLLISLLPSGLVNRHFQFRKHLLNVYLKLLLWLVPHHCLLTYFQTLFPLLLIRIQLYRALSKLIMWIVPERTPEIQPLWIATRYTIWRVVRIYLSFSLQLFLSVLSFANEPRIVLTLCHWVPWLKSLKKHSLGSDWSCDHGGMMKPRLNYFGLQSDCENGWVKHDFVLFDDIDVFGVSFE